MATSMPYLAATALNAAMSLCISASSTLRSMAVAVQDLPLPSILLKEQVVPIRPPAWGLTLGSTVLITPPKSPRCPSSCFMGKPQ